MRVGILVAVAGLLVAPVVLSAQQPSNLPSPSEAETMLRNPNLSDRIRQQIQSSGLTADQIRARLSAAGYSPTLLDSYLGTSAQASNAQPTQEVFTALSALGVGPTPVQGLEPVAVDTGATEAGGRRARPARGLELFGAEIFRNRTSQFQPILTGPVPPSYRVGPGDVMVLVLTGDVELAPTLEVTREGFVVIPQVGQIYVNGLTMEQMRQTLRERLSRAYSGIRTGTTRFDVTIARLRTNQVYVVGEAMQPGAYQLASVATVLNALYAAGGPSDRGDFRSIQVRRGEKVVTTFDLYDYLLRGDTRNDIILEQGDVVFIPTYNARVSLTGAVVRPAIYQVSRGQQLADVIAAGGGFLPEAELRRVTIYRLVPAASRGPGRPPRVAIDVPLATAGDSVALPVVGLEDGDSVAVDRVVPLDQSYYVSITGMVEKPGRYPWHQGITLREIMNLARGPRIGADLRRAEIARMPEDRSTGDLAKTVQVALDSSYLFDRDSAGRYTGVAGVAFPRAGTTPEIELQPLDNVLILRQPQFEYQRTVDLVGEVEYPGTYALTRKDERLSDLIKRAGGLLKTAYPGGTRFIRSFSNAGRVDVDLAKAMASPGSTNDIILQPGDSVTVPEYNPTVRVEGGVNTPTSVLYQEGKDLSYYIDNAGGYARTADKGRVSVRYANGSAETKGKFLFWSKNPTPGPGSVVVVPLKPDDKTDVRGLIADITQIVATVATLLIVALRT